MKLVIVKKRNNTMHSIIAVAIFFLVSSCGEKNTKTTHNNMRELSHHEQLIKQQNDDLLNGYSKAVCYSGFRSGQHPDRGDGAKNPSYEEILEDLRIISNVAGFKMIRIYDCSSNSEMILSIIKEHKIDIKVMLGIWLRAELSNHNTCSWLNSPIPDDVLASNKKLNLGEVQLGIELANLYKDEVIAVNIGNEALVDWNDHKVDTDTIISYVEMVSASIEQPVTVAENYKWWADHGYELSKVVDFVSIHLYPIWEGRNINQGLSYSIDNVLEVRNKLPNAKIVVAEAGWPSVSSEFGDIASENNQDRYYEEFMTWCAEMNITTFWFEAFDEDWKGNPNDMMGAEKHWGLYTVDRTPKLVMRQFQEQYKVK
ncbi:MAG: glycosyl hydrolase family 17 protein [Bacteroidales bacterium]|jgi:exo-beta-1,3-glucanase (GH17 family)|nr:glycosyl hydrolase family 17 protein [Bacteroidales bacterium]MDG1901777.1 glycosyl hydrolase family 17 protein [Bacteroidales bacterium]MDG2081343.1 glycosyl hydrolase family 17 protein [Bacteroidales bacterium]